MQLKVSHKIALGFAFLVFSIILVGAGGLWGANNIKQSLNQVSGQSLPTVVGSLKQMITLQEANQSLLRFMASSATADSRKAEQRLFNQQLDNFSIQLTELSENYQLSPEQNDLLATTNKTKDLFSSAALAAMTLHQQQLMLMSA